MKMLYNTISILLICYYSSAIVVYNKTNQDVNLRLSEDCLLIYQQENIVIPAQEQTHLFTETPTFQICVLLQTGNNSDQNIKIFNTQNNPQSAIMILDDDGKVIIESFPEEF